MNERKKKTINTLAGAVEILVVSIAYYQVWDVYRSVLGMDLFHFRGKFFLIGLYIVIAYLVFRTCECLRFDRLKAFDLAVSQCIGCILINMITWVQICLVVNGIITPMPLVGLTLIDFLICILFSVVCTTYFRKHGGTENGLLVCGTPAAMRLKEKFEKQKHCYHVEETISAQEGLEQLCKAVDRHAFVILNDIPAKLRNDLMKYCYSSGKSIYVVPKITDILVRGTEEISVFDTPLLRVRNEGLSPVEEVIKRVFDIIISVLIMIPGSVLMLLVAAAIRLEDGGPVFYTQKRITKDGRVFDILKFRSMIVDAEKKTGAVLAAEGDSRITKVGKFLRSCRLDEFPQFLNVLKGDMSVVGPRPERVELTEELSRDIPEFIYRTRVKGGITGYAQVYGKYNTVPYDKLRYDLIYIEQYSLLLDIKLILMTPQILFRKEATEGVSEKT